MTYVIDPHLVNLARRAKTEAELLTVSRRIGIELTEEQEHFVYERLHSPQAEIAKSELDNVSGGCVVDDELLAVFS